MLAKEIVWDNIWLRMNTFRHDFIKNFSFLKFNRILPTERSGKNIKSNQKYVARVLLNFRLIRTEGQIEPDPTIQSINVPKKFKIKFIVR